jgi:hypothetical protein
MVLSVVLNYNNLGVGRLGQGWGDAFIFGLQRVARETCETHIIHVHIYKR